MLEHLPVSATNAIIPPDFSVDRNFLRERKRAGKNFIRQFSKVAYTLVSLLSLIIIDAILRNETTVGVEALNIASFGRFIFVIAENMRGLFYFRGNINLVRKNFLSSSYEKRIPGFFKINVDLY